MSCQNVPAISVIMSVFKEPIDWLRQSLDSIIHQTFDYFEFIIICDNPNYAEGITLLNEYAQKDNRIKLIYNDENVGLTKSLNRGLSIASGKYIARMDADDVSMPRRFECQYDFLESHPEVDVCGCNFFFFGDVTIFSNKKSYLPITHKEIISYLACKNPIAHPTVMMRRVICGSTFSYDESIKKAQDYMLWYDLFRRGAVFHNLNSRLLKYRISSTQITNSANTSQNVTADLVRSRLLEADGVNEYHKTLHNEIFNALKTDKPLQDKLNWLLSLIKKSSSFSKGPYKSLLWFYYVKACLLYSDLGYLSKQKKNILENISLDTLIRLFVAYKRNRF